MLSIYGCFYAGHDWAITQLQPLFHSLGHQVRVQTAVMASKGNQRGDVKIKGYLKHDGGERDLVYDLSVTHERWGATDEPCKNRQLCYPDDINRPLQEEAAQKKVLEYQNAYANATTQQAHVSRRAHGANRDSIGRTALRREATAPGKCKSIRYGCGKDAPADELCVR